MSRAVREALAWVHLTGFYPFRVNTQTMMALSTRVAFSTTGSPDGTPGHSLLQGEGDHLKSRTMARAESLQVLGFTPVLSEDREDRAREVVWSHPQGHRATLTPGRAGLVTIQGEVPTGSRFLVVADLHVRAPHSVSITIWDPYRRKDLTTGSPLTVIQALMGGRYDLPAPPVAVVHQPPVESAVRKARAFMARGGPQDGLHLTDHRRAMAEALVTLIHLQGLGLPVAATANWVASLAGVCPPTAHKWMKAALRAGMVEKAGSHKPPRGRVAATYSPTFPVVLVDGLPEPHWPGLERWEDAHRTGGDARLEGNRELTPRKSSRGFLLRSHTPMTLLREARVYDHEAGQSPISLLGTSLWWLLWGGCVHHNSITHPATLLGVSSWLASFSLLHLRNLLGWLDICPHLADHWDASHKPLMAAMVTSWVSNWAAVHLTGLGLLWLCRQLGLEILLEDAMRWDPVEVRSMATLLHHLQDGVAMVADPPFTGMVPDRSWQTGQSTPLMVAWDISSQALTDGLPISLLQSLVAQVMATWTWAGCPSPFGLRDVRVEGLGTGSWRGSWAAFTTQGLGSLWVFPLSPTQGSPMTSPVGSMDPETGRVQTQPGPYLTT